MNRSEFSIYVHIPYCTHRCPYCDFNVHVAKRIPEERYSKSLVAELARQAATTVWKPNMLASIFFGGGTPSTFSPRSFAVVIDSIRENFPTLPNIEISLEANPSTLSALDLQALRSVGVNRLSLGVQSFNDHLLRQLGRSHSAQSAIEAIALAKSAGFTDINTDLIFGIPNQSLADFENDLQVALDQKPQHLSCYALTIEAGTPFHQWQQEGRLAALDEVAVANMFEYAADFLPAHGFEQYEVSNYSTVGHVCRHNLHYWQGGSYLGVGAGAHSFLRRDFTAASRWANISYPDSYHGDRRKRKVSPSLGGNARRKRT